MERNYQAALRSALGVYEDDAPVLGTQVLPNLVEAAARCGETALADTALGRLAERALAAGTPLALGLLAWSRALLADDDNAEPLYEQAIGHLTQTRAAPQLARVHLVYGEWLRRQRRRRDARERLRIAHDMLTSMGAEAFAERARIELLATGERARHRTAESQGELTPQEAQIAKLVSKGEGNRDIAAQQTEPALVITSTLAHAAWHLSHSSGRHSCAAKLYPFAATRPRWPSPNMPIASPFLFNGTAAARRIFLVHSL